MIDVSKMSDKELFELEKVLKAERAKRGSYICYKSDLYPTEKFRELFKILYGIDLYAERNIVPKDFEDPYFGTSMDAFRSFTDALVKIVDISTGNCAIVKRKSYAENVTRYTIKRNPTVECDIKKRYADALSEITDILLREAKETGKIKVKE